MIFDEQQIEKMDFNGVETTHNMLEATQKMVETAINEMGDNALNEIFSGQQDDIDHLFRDITTECLQVLETGEHNGSDFVIQLENTNRAMEEAMRLKSLIYFINSVYGDTVELSYHHLEWAQLVNHSKKVALLASRDSGKSFFFNGLYPTWQMYRYRKDDPELSMCKKGFMFSNSDKKASHFLEEIKGFILDNDILRDKLYPDSYIKSAWTIDHLRNKNGSIVDVKGFMGSARGYHPQWLVLDDILTDETIYSPTRRAKEIDYFFSTVMGMLVPNGRITVIGTPFHERDLYHRFRQKDTLRTWIYREYPVMFPDGTLLWEGRYDYERIMEKKLEVGSSVFAREYLLKPATSDTSIFPYKILKPAIYGMEKYTLVTNINAHPLKDSFVKIVTGIDLAKSSKVGADFTAMLTWGIDDKGTYWLLHAVHEKGMAFSEQISEMHRINKMFRPNIMVIETNGFQSIYHEVMKKDSSIPIKAHNTGINKHQENGLVSLAILFENEKVKLPYGDEFSILLADRMMEEFQSIAYTERGGLQSVSFHDDLPMSMWFSYLANVNEGGFDFAFM